jgi:hypothetical protein
MTNPNRIISAHYNEIAATMLDMLDELITDEVQEKLADDPDFPMHADDEVGEKYITEAMDMVYQSIKNRLNTPLL